jgi:hypothetical protein
VIARKLSLLLSTHEKQPDFHAQAKRLASAPLIRFDSQALAYKFGLLDTDVPTMLATVSYAARLRHLRRKLSLNAI